MSSAIQQHTPEWFEAKKSRVGASEIAGLVYHYCQDELKELGISFEPYNTALQTYCKIKFGVELPFPEILSKWGLGMEPYIFQRFKHLLVTETTLETVNNEDPELTYKYPKKHYSILAEQTKDFVIKDDLVACSPDGYLEISEGETIRDFDNQVTINKSWGRGVLEMKTASFSQRAEFKDGFKWPYIFQMQYQMMTCDINYGVGAVLLPKNIWENEDFQKGYILGMFKAYDEGNIIGAIAEGYGFGKRLEVQMESIFDLKYFVYAKKPALIDLIKLALERFRNHLENNILPNPYKGEKQTLIANEKQILAMIHPQRFGEIAANEEQEALLNDMMFLQAEKKKIETEESGLRNQIIHLMQDNIAITSSSYQAKFDSRNALRFKKIN